MKKILCASLFALIMVGCDEPVPKDTAFSDNSKITTGTQTSEPFVERTEPSDKEKNTCQVYFISLPSGEWNTIILCLKDPQ